MILVITVATAGTIVLALGILLHSTSIHLGRQLHSLDGKVAAATTALLNVTELPALSPSHCISVAADRGAITAVREICVLSSAGEIGQDSVLRINFTAIFGSLDNPAGDSRVTCNHTIPVTSPVTGAPILANTTCIAAEPITTPRLKLNANWAGDLDLTLVSETFAPAILGTTGRLEHLAKIKVSGPAIIVSGGDLIIATLEFDFDSASPSDVMLVSATGAVTVGAIVGVGRLSVIGSAPPNIPGNTLLPSEIKLPELDRLVITLRRADGYGT